MAPTRGYRRAIVAVAATITAARFSFRQRSAEPKPAPVRTPTVRAQPRQNTTDAPPLKRKKVAVFYNVYARPRPHPLPDSGATYCGQRPGYICRGHGSEKRCLPDASCK